jgi:hypothetical protein
MSCLSSVFQEPEFASGPREEMMLELMDADDGVKLSWRHFRPSARLPRTGSDELSHMRVPLLPSRG